MLFVQTSIYSLGYLSGDDAEAQQTHVVLFVHIHVGRDRHNLLVKW